MLKPRTDVPTLCASTAGGKSDLLILVSSAFAVAHSPPAEKDSYLPDCHEHFIQSLKKLVMGIFSTEELTHDE
jgi:hypothetical protein